MRVVGSAGNQVIPSFFSKDFRKEPITPEVLAGLKARGLRRRVWYWALDQMERGLVDLTIRWVDKVRSGRMTETLVRILAKLAMALETGIGRVLGRGRILAARASDLAVGLGNEAAFSWRFELAFAKALGLGTVG